MELSSVKETPKRTKKKLLSPKCHLVGAAGASHIEGVDTASAENTCIELPWESGAQRNRVVPRQSVDARDRDRKKTDGASVQGDVHPAAPVDVDRDDIIFIGQLIADERKSVREIERFREGNDIRLFGLDPVRLNFVPIDASRVILGRPIGDFVPVSSRYAGSPARRSLRGRSSLRPARGRRRSIPCRWFRRWS